MYYANLEINYLLYKIKLGREVMLVALDLHT